MAPKKPNFFTGKNLAAAFAAACALTAAACAGIGNEAKNSEGIIINISVQENAPASASRSIMPGNSPGTRASLMPSSYKITVSFALGAPETQTNVFSDGSNVFFSLRRIAPIEITVEAWSEWSGGNVAGYKLLQKTVQFTREETETGTLNITLNPLVDIAPDAVGNFYLRVSWNDVNGLTKLKAELKKEGVPVESLQIEYNSGFTTGTAPEAVLDDIKGATLRAYDIPAGSYILTLTFYKDSVVMGVFFEAVTVWTQMTSNTWYNETGEHSDMSLSPEDFAGLKVAYRYADGYFFYNSISDAFNAASGTAENPDTITIFQDIDISGDEISAISTAFSANKHIKLTVPAGTTCTLKRVTDNTNRFFMVGSGSSLTLEGNGTGELILDGGAVWSGGTPPATLPEGMTSDDFPSPAFGAENSGINATGPLVTVNGGALTMNAGAVLRNNQNTFSTAAGGGVDVTGAGSTFTMNGGAVKGNRTFNNGTDGGGVYLRNYGTFIMNGGAVVKGNRSFRNGGGVLITTYGAFTMNAGAVVSGNRANSNDGGGVYVSATASAFTMSGGSISGNTAGGYGGGVAVNGLFTMSGGTISGNTATGNGGGVCINTSTFTMSNGTISGNTVTGASSKGKGVYANGTSFTMSGDAVVNADNDVYLPASKMITINDTLSGTGTVATITPDTYGTTRQVLNASGGGSIAGNNDRFAVTPNGTTPWGIGSDGKLAQAVARRGAVSPYSYYATLALAIAAASGTSGNPDTITILQNIDINASVISAITTAFSNKHIKLTVPAGTTRTLKRITPTPGGAFFTVGSGSSLTLEGNGDGKLILDGGAVWSGSTPATLPEGMTPEDFPSPAFDAENDSGINATGQLVLVNGGALTMNEGAVLQNNYNSSGNGGGVYVTSGGEFTMNAGAVLRNNQNITADTAWGGGVYVTGNSSRFTMNGGAVVKGNRSFRNGGGVNVTNGGTFTMNGGTISGNTASNNTGVGNGGGVFAQGGTGTFIMNGGMVNGNRAASAGGVAVTGTFTMFGGTISGNTATQSAADEGGYGGGVNTANPTGGSFAFTMSGGTISGNTATQSGGGVHVNGNGNGAFTMSGGTINGNTATINGDGVCFSNGTFTMSDAAVINANNDVFLPSDKMITIGGILSGIVPVATITPNAYTAGTQVLAANSYLAGNYNRFAVTQSGWVIDSDGKLAQ